MRNISIKQAEELAEKAKHPWGFPTDVDEKITPVPDLPERTPPSSSAAKENEAVLPVESIMDRVNRALSAKPGV